MRYLATLFLAISIGAMAVAVFAEPKGYIHRGGYKACITDVNNSDNSKAEKRAGRTLCRAAVRRDPNNLKPKRLGQCKRIARLAYKAQSFKANEIFFERCGHLEGGRPNA